MKKNIMIVALSVLMGASAFSEDKYPNYQIDIDWKLPDKKQEHSVTQQCDDSYYPAVEVKIPGSPRKDFYIEMNAAITRETPSFGCEYKIIQSNSSTVYEFNAVNGGCEIRIHKHRSNFREAPKYAEVSISDAC